MVKISKMMTKTVYNMPSFSLFDLQDKHGLKKLILRASTCKTEEIIDIIKKIYYLLSNFLFIIL